MLRLSRDETRALTLVVALLLASGGVRYARRPAPLQLTAPELDVPALADSSRAAMARAERAGTPLGEGERLDPNAAGVTELQRLPGIGPALAARIVAYRDSAGRFRTLEELTRVPGIGPATLERLRPHLGR